VVRVPAGDHQQGVAHRRHIDDEPGSAVRIRREVGDDGGVGAGDGHHGGTTGILADRDHPVVAHVERQQPVTVQRLGQVDRGPGAPIGRGQQKRADPAGLPGPARQCGPAGGAAGDLDALGVAGHTGVGGVRLPGGAVPVRHLQLAMPVRLGPDRGGRGRTVTGRADQSAEVDPVRRQSHLRRDGQRRHDHALAPLLLR